MSDNQKKQCIACAQPIYKDAKICPYCGTQQPPPKSSSGCSTIIGGAVIVFIILARASNTCSSSNSKTISQQPIQTEVKTNQQVTPVLPNDTKNSYSTSVSKPSNTTQSRHNMPSTIVDNSTTQASTKTQTEDIRSLQKTDNQNTTTSFKETQQAQQEINQQENSKKEERQRKKQERKLKKQEKKNRQTE